MPKWTDYTIKANPADKDEVMTLDTAGKVNKRLGHTFHFDPSNSLVMDCCCFQLSADHF